MRIKILLLANYTMSQGTTILSLGFEMQLLWREETKKCYSLSTLRQLCTATDITEKSHSIRDFSQQFLSRNSVFI